MRGICAYIIVGAITGSVAKPLCKERKLIVPVKEHRLR